MLEVIGLICIVYMIGLVLTLVVGNTIGGSWNEPMGFCIIAGMSVLWFIFVPMIVYDKWKDRKNDKDLRSK